jgi:hypothetical protein
MVDALRAFQRPSGFRYPPQKDRGDVVDLRDSLTEHQVTSA